MWDYVKPSPGRVTVVSVNENEKWPEMEIYNLEKISDIRDLFNVFMCCFVALLLLWVPVHEVTGTSFIKKGSQLNKSSLL